MRAPDESDDRILRRVTPTPTAPATPAGLQPTVTIGGAPAGYKPATTFESTATFGGAPAAYQSTPTTNYITGQGVTQPSAPAPTTTAQTKKDTGGSVPAINNRSQEPGTPRAGFKWQWFSMAYANNQYGGEWREVPVSGGGGGTGGAGDTGQTSSNATLISTETDDFGNVIGFYSDGTSKTLISSGRKTKTTVDENAYAILEQTFRDYGLEELVPVIQGYMDRNLGANQATIELRKEPAYQARFAGNETRRKVGLNVLSEAEYLNLENSYNETLRAYGLQNYFGNDRIAKQKAAADIIGNDISAVEFKDRVDTVVTRVSNSDPTIKSTLRSFYNITDDDLVSYFLNPKENLPKLQQKVTTAEIGAAATTQGLKTSLEAASALAEFGVTKQQAQEGYQAIGAVLPTATKLGEIYNQGYTQQEAEQEVFKGLASARRKREQLVAQEEASFSGSSGRLRTGKSRANEGAF